MPVLPTLPLMFDVPYMLPTGGQTWHVHQGDNLQGAIDGAQLGDVILVDPVPFTGTFKLPVKTGTSWLYIVSSELNLLPKEGNRVRPEDAVHMPKIIPTPNNNLGALYPYKNAHHYRFAGIEFKVQSADPITNMFNVIQTGYGKNATYGSAVYNWAGVTDDAELPHHITFDRCYVHSLNVYPKTCRCGYMMNGHYMACVDSYFKNFADGSDAQAINIIVGSGPYKIVNNYLEATGENFMSGGSDPSVTDAIMEDLEFRGNYCYKDRAAWEPHFTIKNLFELKNGKRVLCAGNWFENCYKDDQGQGATALVLTVRNQSGNNPGSQLQDITIAYNRIKTCGKAWRLTGYDDLHPSLQTQRVLIEHNAWEDINNLATVPNCGQISSTSLGPALDVTVRNNLLVGTTKIGTLLSLLDGASPYYKVVQNFAYENNIGCHSDYGLFGGVVGTGNIALTTYALNYLWQKNVCINRSVVDRDYAFWKTHFAGSYPPNNALADEMAGVGFTDYANGNYRLLASSPYHSWGSDGKDPGPDWDGLDLAMAHVKDGQTRVESLPAPLDFVVN